jgi:hypothetical protein
MQMSKKDKKTVDTNPHPWYHHTCRRESGGPDEVFLQKTSKKCLTGNTELW